jgi:hypothetical protein
MLRTAPYARVRAHTESRTYLQHAGGGSLLARRSLYGNDMALCGTLPPALSALCQSIECHDAELEGALPECAALPDPSPPPQQPSSPPPTGPLTFTCAADDAATDCAALSALYEATNGGSWAFNDGWRDAAAGVATSFCTFWGVTCSGNFVRQLCVHRRLLVCACARISTEIDAPSPFDRSLVDNRLTGSIPSAFGSLAAPFSMCVVPLRGRHPPHWNAWATRAWLAARVAVGVSALTAVSSGALRPRALAAT